MHLDLYIVLGSALVGLLVGLTGTGGGALMTPMLTLLFGVPPVSAISSDLVASVVMRPAGALVHLRAGSVNRRLVVLLAGGSVPAAFAGSYVMSRLGNSAGGIRVIELVLGVALLLGAAAMAARRVLGRRAPARAPISLDQLVSRPLVSVAIGVVGGFVVGMTSVGAGSLMVVMLLFAYPLISAKQLVGTDLAQAVPLTLAAAAGAFAFGHVQLALTGSLIVGSLPAVCVGALLSSRVPDRYLRPVIMFAILGSGLKYVGVGASGLAWILCGVLGLVTILALVKRVSGLRAARASRAGTHEQPDRPFVHEA